MHGVHTQLLQVVDGPRLGQRQVLAWILARLPLDVDCGVEIDVAGYREVAVVQLVDHEVFAGNVGAAVLGPALGVGVAHVDDGAALAVHAHSLGFGSRALAQEVLAIFHVEGVELALEVALERGLIGGQLPLLVAHAFHLDGFHRLAACALVVDAQYHGLGTGQGVELEGGLARGVDDGLPRGSRCRK